MAPSETDPLLWKKSEQQKSKSSITSVGSTTEYAQCPTEWPKATKWRIVAVLSFLAFNVSFTCISIVPAAESVVSDLGKEGSNEYTSVLLVTVWELGEAAGPLLLAPLSELLGRYPVILAANAVFIMANILGVLSSSTWLFIASRFLAGLAVAPNVLNPAIVGDMFIPEKRGSPMAIVMAAPLVGGTVGPAIGGVIAHNLGWRTVLWLDISFAVICQVLILATFKETYSVHRRRSAVQTVLAPQNEADIRTLNRIWLSIARPADILLSSNILKVLCVFHGVAFTLYYIMAVTLPKILDSLYGRGPDVGGLAFTVYTTGSGISVLICQATLDRIYKKLRKRNKMIGLPEYRLPLAIAGSLLIPIAVLLYGWAANFQLSLFLFLFSLVLLGTSITLASIPVFAYVVDAFGVYSTSAVADLIVTRCLMGAVLPLLVPPLVRDLGYGLGFTVIGASCFCLLPIPALVLRYGSKWRQRSKYTIDN